MVVYYDTVPRRLWKFRSA